MDSTVYTIEEKCSGCNKCIYNCPVEDANTAYIVDDINKVHINADQCIMCGQCLDTCDHNARDYKDDTARLIADLTQGTAISVIVAPALKVNFPQYEQILGYLQSLGANFLFDVAFGADIATWAYLRTIEQNPGRSLISQPCASVVSYVQKHRHDLLPHLAPVQSPMMCTAIYLRKYLKNTDKLCFLSPCIAKLAEVRDENTAGCISYNVTFKKLLDYASQQGVELNDCQRSELTLPAWGLGDIYSFPGGLKENIHLYDPTAWVKQVEGTALVYEYLTEYEERKKQGKSLPLVVDALNCQHGCNIGSGTLKDLEITDIEQRVRELRNSKMAAGQLVGREIWQRFDKMLSYQDFIRQYTPEQVNSMMEPSEDEYQAVFRKMYKISSVSQERNCFACGYRSCRHMAKAIFNQLNHKENCIDYNLQISADKVGSLELKNREITDLMEEFIAKSEELAAANQKLRELDEVKSNFISTVSHELRTPLTSVLGFAKIIKKKLEENIFPVIQSDDKKVVRSVQQVTDNIGIIVEEGERLTNLINDVLDLAKMEAGKTEWRKEYVTVEELIDRATAATSSLFEQKGLILIKDLPANLPPVMGDRDRLLQVLINLISNGIKFTDEGSITCQAKLVGNSVVISVIDTGMGIAPDNHHKIFEQFKQVGNVLTDKPKGTGLGLPICKHIISHHGGEIWVSSSLGKGSTFSFSLSLSNKPDKLAAIESELFKELKGKLETVPPLRTGQKRILVVDDESSIRQLLRQEFEEVGYVVTEAVDGIEAIEKSKEDRPDLIILDVMMPKMNGFDAAAVLKNDPGTRDIPIIILSIVEDKIRGFQIGVDRYLTKPTDMSELLKEVEVLLAHGGSKKKVLIVNEDESMVRTLTNLLTAKEFQVAEAYNYHECIEKIRQEQPDVIIVDTMFSEKNKVATALSFHKNSEKVLVIVNNIR